MSRFSELTSDKQHILGKFISSQELCKAVYYNDRNFLDQPDIPDPSVLIYNHIFPHFFIPDISAEQRTYITLSFRNYRPVENSYKAGLVYIHVFTHKDLYQSSYGKLRTDFLLEKIDALMNDIPQITIGKINFEKMDEYIVNSNYSGNFVSYRLYEFN